jgi:hypothetical protein
MFSILGHVRIRKALDPVIPRLPSHNCSKSGRSLSSVFLGNPDGSVQPHTTDIMEAAYSAPRYDQNADDVIA